MKAVQGYRRNDELSGEQADGREDAVGEQGEGGEGVDGGVDVRQSFQALEATVLASAVAVPQRAMARERDFHGSQSPPQHLVEPI